MSRSHRVRFVLIALIFIGIQTSVAMIGWAALKAINATRAYATGESIYSKGQKSAVLNLFKYAQDGREENYLAFLDSIKLPLGDRIAREALDRTLPDFDTAADGLRQSLTNEDDIPSVLLVFMLLRHWGPFAQAVADWRQGDHLVAQIIATARQFHSTQAAGAATAADRAQFLRAIDTVNTSLDALEYRFSDDLGDAARSAMRLVSLGLAVCSAGLWIAGLWLAWRTYSKGVTQDVQLRESDRRFRDFAETASDWFWQTSADHRLTYLSQRFAEALDLQPEELRGKTFSEIGLEWFGESAENEFANVSARRPFRGVGLRSASGIGSEQYWTISGVPVFGEDGTFSGYRGTGRNVTEEIHAKHALEEAKTQSELASRAKSEFLATMSHELRTPLNAIIGFAEVIKDQLFGPAMDRYADYARDIYSSGQHLLSIINDILDMSKIEAGQMALYEENIAVPEAIEGVVRLFRQKISEAELRLTIQVDDLPYIRADDRKLKQILMNLLSNAVKFTPPGGKISIASFLDPNGDLRIEVRDSGIGMAHDDIPKALAAFGQIDSSLARKHEGTGLGLPLVQALAALHGGQFFLDSERGRGTSAIVVLPKTRILRLAA